MRNLKFFSFGLLLMMGLEIVVFSACSDDDKKEEIVPNTTDKGVIINGVKWATRNIASPGTFAAKSEDVGAFYQWNSKVVWSTTGKTDWSSDIWEKANDPSPAGWRVPTLDEFKTLFNSDKVSFGWSIENGIAGCRCTDKATRNSIFLPASGQYLDGESYNGGYYWTSTPFTSGENCKAFWRFDNVSCGYAGYWAEGRCNVRSVAK